MEKAKKQFKILAAGDIHGDSRITEILAKRAEREKVDLVILTGDIIGLIPAKNLIKPFLDRNQKVVFVPGNWETTEHAKALSKKYNIKNVEDNYLRYENVGIFGVGSADWALYPDDEKTFKKLKQSHEKIKNLEKKIMISHVHAAGTMSELSGIRGSDALRAAIKEFQPDYFIHSHIHELEGAEEHIGKTKVINVGRKGRIIRL
jgi:Icc-related predicted phosphoesterase